MKKFHDLDEIDELDENVSISISRSDADVLYRILTQLGHGKIASFDAECKFCGKAIKMFSNDGGEHWKPTNRKTGEIHTCKQGRLAYQKKRKFQEADY